MSRYFSFLEGESAMVGDKNAVIVVDGEVVYEGEYRGKRTHWPKEKPEIATHGYMGVYLQEVWDCGDRVITIAPCGQRIGWDVVERSEESDKIVFDVTPISK